MDICLYHGTKGSWLYCSKEYSGFQVTFPGHLFIPWYYSVLEVLSLLVSFFFFHHANELLFSSSSHPATMMAPFNKNCPSIATIAKLTLLKSRHLFGCVRALFIPTSWVGPGVIIASFSIHYICENCLHALTDYASGMSIRGCRRKCHPGGWWGGRFLSQKSLKSWSGFCLI